MKLQESQTSATRFYYFPSDEHFSSEVSCNTATSSTYTRLEAVFLTCPLLIISCFLRFLLVDRVAGYHRQETEPWHPRRREHSLRGLLLILREKWVSSYEFENWLKHLALYLKLFNLTAFSVCMKTRRGLGLGKSSIRWCHGLTMPMYI